MRRRDVIAVLVTLLGGAQVLSAGDQTQKQVCEADNGHEAGCPNLDCQEACPGWTELEMRCSNNVTSCWGLPPSGGN